jgi:hypothetical protein
MMMEKAKPHAANKETFEEVDDRQAEIERRLAALGKISSDDAPAKLSEETLSHESDIDRNQDGTQTSPPDEQVQDLLEEKVEENCVEESPAQDSLHDAAASVVLESSNDVPSCESSSSQPPESATAANESVKPPTNNKSALLVSTCTYFCAVCHWVFLNYF